MMYPPDLVFRALKVVSAGVAGLLLIASVAAQWGEPTALAVTILIAAVALFTPGPANADTDQSDLANWAGIAVVLGIAVQSLAWTHLFNSQQGSDFGVYYRCGFDLRPTLVENLQACQSAYISYGDLYWRRSLLSTVPFGWLGGGYDGLKFANAVFQAGAGAVLWLAARRWTGTWGAFVAVLIFALYPERSFALTLATSDHVSLLLTSLGLAALAPLASSSLMIAGAASIVVGIIIVALDLARSTGIFLLAAAILVMFIQTLPRSGLRAFALNLAIMVGTVTAARMVAGSVLGPTGTGDGFMRLASSLHIDTAQGTLNSFRWLHHFWPAIPPEHRNLIGLTRLMQEFLSEGASYPAYVWDKAQTLTAGYGYIWFAANDLAGNKDTVLTAATIHVPHWFDRDPALARLCLIPVLALTFAGSLRAPRTGLACGALGFFSAAVSGVVFIGEVQARYLMIVLPAAAILAGLSFTDREPRSVVRRLQDLTGGVVAVAGVILLGLGLWAVSRDKEPDPWSQPLPLDGSDCDTSSGQIDADARQLTLHLASGETCAGASFTLPPSIDTLTFFLSDGQFPYRFETLPPTSLNYQIVAGVNSAEGSLDAAHVVWRRLPVASTRPTRVIVTARRAAGTSGNAATLIFAYPMSWR